MRKMKKETKKTILRVIVLIMAAALLLSVIIIPLSALNVSAEGVTDVVVTSFDEGALSSAIETAKDGTDLNQITRISISGGTLNAADFQAICGYPNIERLELSGADVKDGIIPDNALSARNKLSAVSLPKNTVEIGANAFSNNRELISVIMPSTVRRIDDYAFSGCEKVTQFSIPAKTEYIGAGAFADCKALTAFELPEAITEIPENCFSKASLTEMHIGPQVTKIGANAFENCHGLENVYFYGDTAPTIESGAFQNVHVTIHTYEGTEGFDSQTNEFISVSPDMSPSMVYAPPVDTGEEDKVYQTEAPETSADAPEDTTVTEEEKQETEKQTTIVTPSEKPVTTSAPSQGTTGSANVILIVVIAILVLLVGVFATLFFAGRKK